MAIDRFTKQEFEGALPFHKDTNLPMWTAAGLVQGEETYHVAAGEHARIEVRSSVDGSGRAADTGQDSIRMWLQVRTPNGWRPFGKKMDAWTTRMPGWQGRMQAKIRELYKRGTAVKQPVPECSECGRPFTAWIVKAGQNAGRPAAKCIGCASGFVWLDVEGKVVVEGARKGASVKVATADVEPASLETILAGGVRGAAAPLPLPVDERVHVEEEEEAVVRSAPERGEVSGKAPVVSDQQRAAIEAPIDKAARVLAGPGSGKTFVLERRYAHLLENGAKPDDILAVTFNKTMADELYERICRFSPQVRDTSAAQQICTIHAMCFRLLKAEGDKRQVAKFWQMKRMLQDIGLRLWGEAESRPPWTEIENAIGNAKAMALVPGRDERAYTEWFGPYHGGRLAMARRVFDQEMRRAGTLTFTDMLYGVERKLIDDREFRERWQARFKYVMVDEAQDVSRQALRILITLSFDPPDNPVYSNPNWRDNG